LWEFFSAGDNSQFLPENKMATSRIVIIGGGFAGVKWAKTLRHMLPRDEYEIVIFNRSRFHGGSYYRDKERFRAPDAIHCRLFHRNYLFG
jgi:cation diffusion facilitator CzcD-associated flavoprotein CzcO